jgi:EpsI family protein
MPCDGSPMSHASAARPAAPELPRGWPGLVAALLGVAFAYRSTFAWLFEIWQEDEYSHGFLILPISAYLVWIRRREIALIPRQPNSWAGGLLLLLAALFLVVGRASAYSLLEGVSFLLVVPAAVLFLWGWGHLKALALPILYLQFMVPWYEVLLDRIRLPFQLASAAIGGALLRLLGYPVLREGLYLQLPKCALEVAPDCSGLSFLITVLALGFPLVYLTQRSWRKAIAVLAAGAVVMFLANGLRVALVGIMISTYGKEMSHGPYHVFQGMVVAWVGLLILFFINWMLCRGPAETGPRLYERAAPRRGEEGADALTRGGAGRRALLFGLCVALLGFYVQWFLMPQPVPAATALERVPLGVGQWQGTPSSWLAGERFFPGVDDELLRAYTHRDAGRIFLYIGHFSRQTRGKTLVNHKDRALWGGASVVSTGLTTASGPERVVLSRASLGGRDQVLGFWYLFNSGGATSRLRAKLISAWDDIASRRNNGAVIVVAAPPDEHQGAEGAERAVLAFVRELGPSLAGLEAR